MSRPRWEGARTETPPRSRAAALVSCVVVDRDGTLIAHEPYLHEPARVRVLPGVRDALGLLRSEGVPIYLHTNQSGIGRGWYTMDDVERCNAAMIEQIDLGPDVFAGVCIAPESPEQPAVYRKPSPRFAREMLAANGWPAPSLRYLGDNVSDVKTAAAVGALGVGVNTGPLDLHSVDWPALGLAVPPIFNDLLAAAQFVLTFRTRVE